MSDRVAIIGGSTPGRDHFPFAVEDAFDPVGDGYIHPFAATAAEAVHLLLHCKKFAVTSGTITYTGGSGTFAGVSDEIGQTAAREAELVVNWPIDDSGTPVEYLGGPMSYVYFQPFLVVAAGGYNLPVAWSGAALWPLFYSGINVLESDEPVDPPSFAGFGLTTRDLFGSNIVAGTLTLSTRLLNKTMPLYKNGVDYEADITVECIEYWPYAVQPFLPDGVTPHPNAGLPVYNTATGAVIRDPITGF